jgi:predicted RNA-binding Zn-ribbon protein involved in translation (DUF1610 family)
VTRTFESRERIGSAQLQIQVAPGHPVCGKCKVPLNAAVLAQGSIQTSCPKCGDQGRYDIPAQPAIHSALLGVVSNENRSGHTRMGDPQGGAVALKCPSCGGALQLAGESRLQTCRFCQAACVVPHGTFSRARNETPEPEVWWMLLQGLSAERLNLENPMTVGIPGTKVAALNMVKPMKGPTEIPREPGVYEAPEPAGIDILQWALTIAAAFVALLIGWLVAGQF